MKFAEFERMYKRIEASCREQRPEMSQAGIKELVMDALELVDALVRNVPLRARVKQPAPSRR